MDTALYAYPLKQIFMTLRQCGFNCVYYILTLNSKRDIPTDWFAKSIVSSTFISSLMLFTTYTQRHSDNAVVRHPCPIDRWCWVPSGFTVKEHGFPFIYCSVSTNVSDYWSNYQVNNTEP